MMNQLGEWLYYNRYGEKVERRFYGNDGKLDQENITYHGDKLYQKMLYNHDVLTQVVYYDKSGKEIWKCGSPDGNFEAKHFYPFGQLTSEGHYKNGVRDGKWTRYYINGLVKASYNYLDGNFNGEQIDYHQNGKKEDRFEFQSRKTRRILQEFYVTGNKLKEGWNSTTLHNSSG